MKREILINPRGTDFVPACEGCGHPPHGVFCPTRTEASNGDKDICLCEAGYGKTEPISPESGEEFGGVEISKPMLERTDPKQDAKQFVDGMGELRRQAELRRLEEAAKQFLRDTGVGPIADHMSVHAWMAAFAYTQVYQAPDNSTQSTPIKTNVNRCEPWTHVWVKSPELPVSCDVCGISISEAVNE